jgi:hypothetical protein
LPALAALAMAAIAIPAIAAVVLTFFIDRSSGSSPRRRCGRYRSIRRTRGKGYSDSKKRNSAPGCNLTLLYPEPANANPA